MPTASRPTATPLPRYIQAGNALFAAGSHQEALQAYSQALELGGADAALLRCGTHRHRGLDGRWSEDGCKAALLIHAPCLLLAATARPAT